MTHPIMQLQAALVSALRADAELTALTGTPAVYDAPPEGRAPPYVVMARHDALDRSGDGAPGHEHRLIVHLWAASASRKAVLALAERVVAVALEADLDGAGQAVTHRLLERTDTAIDPDTGLARAALSLKFFSEPK